MESLLPLIIQLVSGAVGGNAVGSIFKNLSLGGLGNSIAGIVGGGLGGSLLGMLGMGIGGGGMDAAGILGTVASSAVGGGVLMTVIGFIKRLMGK